MGRDGEEETKEGGGPGGSASNPLAHWQTCRTAGTREAWEGGEAGGAERGRGVGPRRGRGGATWPSLVPKADWPGRAKADGTPEKPTCAAASSELDRLAAVLGGSARGRKEDVGVL